MSILDKILRPVVRTIAEVVAEQQQAGQPPAERTQAAPAQPSMPEPMEPPPGPTPAPRPPRPTARKVRRPAAAPKAGSRAPADAASPKRVQAAALPAAPPPAVQSERAAAAAAELDPVARAFAGQLPLTALDIPQLQEMYKTVFGRETDSTHKRYLIQHIRGELRKHGTTAPFDGRRRPIDKPLPETYEIHTFSLQLRRESVNALDHAWKRMGYTSRTAFIREGIATLLQQHGEDAVAAMFTGDDAGRDADGGPAPAEA